MKILVTGAAGYIGSLLAPALLNEGHTVIALDNFLYNQISLLDCCYNSNVTIIRGDVRDDALVTELLKQVDAVALLAGIVGAPACDRDPLTARSVNLDAITSIIKRSSRDQILIYPNTNSGYGIGQKDKFCTEETPLRPISLYGRLKVEAEEAILARGNAISLRLATAFGISPRMRLDLLVNDFTYRAVTDRHLVLFEADAARNYVHVRDAVSAFLYGLKNFDAMKDQAYNVGHGESNMTKRELCQLIQAMAPDFHFVESAVGSDPDKRDYIVSNEKIERAGWKAAISLQEGIRELIKGFAIIRKNQYSNV